MPEPTRPRDWADRLGSEELPPAVAAWYAQWGSTDQRHDVAMNCAAPVDAQLLLAADPDSEVARAVLMNWDAATEVVAVLLDRFPGDDRVVTHPNAPIAVKLDQPLHRLVNLPLTRFLDTVLASDDERHQLHRTAERFNGSVTLRAAWHEVRNGRWRRPPEAE